MGLDGGEETGRVWQPPQAAPRDAVTLWGSPTRPFPPLDFSKAPGIPRAHLDNPRSPHIMGSMAP